MAFILKLANYVQYELESITTEQGRRYKVPGGGNEYESITTALGKRPEKIIALQEWRQKIGIKEAQKITTQASRTGTNVHQIAENYLKNEEDYNKGFTPLEIDMFNKLKPALDENIDEVYGIEMSLYSDRFKLAGRTDCIASWNGKLSIIDFKTSSKPKKEEWVEDYYLQCAGYSFMFNELYKDNIVNNVILITVKETGELQIFENDKPDKYFTHEFFQKRM